MSINILVILVVLFTAYKIYDGYKHGMVKEVISLISMIILCATVALIGGAISSYQGGKYINLVVVVILLAILGIVHHLLGVVFFSAKMISKLPVVHLADKILGCVFGFLEVILLLWTVYVLVTKLNMGAIGQLILSYTKDSALLSWVYQHNILITFVDRLLEIFHISAI